MDEQQKPTISPDPEKLARQCVTICENGKAEDIMLFDVRRASILADFYLICTGTSNPHISGLSQRLRHELAHDGVLPQRCEGDPSSHWVILDYGTVLVHILDPDRRRYYNIEELWQGGTLVYQSPAEQASLPTAVP